MVKELVISEPPKNKVNKVLKAGKKITDGIATPHLLLYKMVCAHCVTAKLF